MRLSLKPSEKPSGRYNPLGKLGLVFAGILGALVIVELTLRLAGFSYLGFLYRSDRDLGWSLLPNVQGFRWNEGGKVFIRTNREGLRDVEHSKRKPPGTFRIAVLGDSFTEANVVGVQQTFWWVAREHLEHCPALAAYPGGVEVINFGVSAYGPTQELVVLRKRVWAYSPDLVLLAFYPGNDVTDTWPSLNGGRQRPYFYLRNGQLVPDNSFRHSSSYLSRQRWYYRFYASLSSHLRVLQLANYFRDVFHSGRIGGRLRGLFARPSQFSIDAESPSNASSVATHHRSSMGGENFTSTTIEADSPGAWHEAWRTVDAILTAMHRECVQHKATFVVVVLSAPEQVYPDRTARLSYQQQWGIEDLFRIGEKLAAIGDREGFAVLDLGPPLQQYADTNHVYLHGFPKFGITGYGHWNASGHQAAGMLIARKLCQMLSPAKITDPSSNTQH